MTEQYRAAIVIINFRTADLTIRCLQSACQEIDKRQDCVVVIDNNSMDDSADLIEQALQKDQLQGHVRLVRNSSNLGFSGGNNTGIRAVSAQYYLFLNSDSVIREHALGELIHALQTHKDVGIVSPRLEDLDTTPQASCFRFHTPLSELIAAAKTGPITRMLKRKVITYPVQDELLYPEWTSFACVLLRSQAIRQVGLMDEDFFMYYEDADYCRKMLKCGWRVLNWPKASVVHFRGGSSPVKSLSRDRKRLPRYYYEARATYFQKWYGNAGLFLANSLWLAGYGVALIRMAFGNTSVQANQGEWKDIWIKKSNNVPLQNPKKVQTVAD
jgi:N-acetylglucosaminyl-diphospho-decaprenol L-rhamnosyltransferase